MIKSGKRLRIAQKKVGFDWRRNLPHFSLSHRRAKNFVRSPLFKKIEKNRSINFLRAIGVIA